MVEPSHRGHSRSHKGGVEVGRRVKLPRGAEQPIRVYINGVEQDQGSDYRLGSGEIVFDEPIVKEGKLGGIRWAALWIGLFGSYRKNETIDVEYRIGEKTHLASDLPVEADPV